MSFSSIIGQERAKKFLKAVVSREKIPHAYLFTGIAGVGKTATAKALTMALNCREPVRGDGCGQCPICRQILNGNFPDFLSIRPKEQSIKIEQIRNLTHRLSFAPITGKYRVCVIYRAEKMTGEAANAFLKTLEEPPPGNIFILNVTEPLDLPPTVVSRCQKVPFQPLAAKKMARWLIREKGLDENEALLLSRISEGSLERALKIMETQFLDNRLEWLENLLTWPNISREQAHHSALGYAKSYKKTGLDMPEIQKVGLFDMLGVWQSWYRDLLVVSVGGEKDFLVNADFSHKMKSMAGNFTIPHLIDSLHVIDQAESDLRKQRNPSLVMEHMILCLKKLMEFKAVNRES